MKYKVEINIPYLYEVEAKDFAEAEEVAMSKFELETNDFIAPDVKVHKVD